MRFYLGVVLLGELIWTSPLPKSQAHGAGATHPAGKAAAVFGPILRELRPAHIPVYLPSWLPAFRMPVYAFGGVSDRQKTSYFVFLSTKRRGGGDANLVFTLDAHAGPGDLTGRPVRLARGIVARINPHTGGNRGATISWALGPNSYEIGYLYPESRLIRSARSMVRIQFANN